MLAKISLISIFSLGLLLACALTPMATQPPSTPVGKTGSTATYVVTVLTPNVTLTSGPMEVSGLPNPALTPGATNPEVTQANIHTTICTSGFTAAVRPSESYTEALKRTQLKDYGYADQSLNDYEEDHLIPLEVGGNPTDPKNLWPEPRYGVYTSEQKDHLENKLHAMVCSGQIDLATAQQAFAGNWVDAYHRWVSPTP